MTTMTISQETTSAFNAALARWVTEAAHQLDHEHLNLLGMCLKADVRVVVRLRNGVITLEGTNVAAGKYIELYRQDVEPLRPANVI
jgi:hypothetical protein